MRLTIHAASIAFRCARDTLKRGLDAIGAKPDKKGGYLIFEIHRALAGDLKTEKTRETKYRADLLEQEFRQKQGELYSATEVQKLMSDTFQPIRDILNQAPSQLATRCNPTDPTLAREALMEWLKTVLPLVRALWPTAAVQTEESK